MGTGSFSRVKSGRGVTLTPHPLLVPWSRKGRAIPLLPPWAARPVQSHGACKRVHFTFTMKIDKRAGSVPDTSLRVGEFQFWSGNCGWFLARWPKNPDFPSGSRFTPDWLCLALFDRDLLLELLTRAQYYSLSEKQEHTVSFSFLNLASVKLEPLGPPHCVKSEIISRIFNIFS